MAKQRRPRGRAFAIGAAFLFIEAVGLRRKTGRIAGTVVVRCARATSSRPSGFPGASLKSVRLGWWRFQHCPIGRHWTLVTPVRESELGETDRVAARQVHDARVP